MSHDIIVIGGSYGSIEGVTYLSKRLPKTLAAATFVVIHVPATATSILPSLFTRQRGMPAYHALDMAAFRPGNIYVAPPDHHLLLKPDNQMRVVRGPRENRHRPAVDTLFRSAAYAYGTRVIGVVLSGYLDDGTAGLKAIKRRGGIGI
jgi:two-component system, chemotaxis family, protein-glutamate methylesterase/glutaminase